MMYSNRHKGFEGINASLDCFKATLQSSYQSLNSNHATRQKLGIDDRMMEDIRKLLTDSYFYEMENLLK